MGLLSIFKRADTAPNAAASEPADAVQQARVRARQRLIGAAVLVLIGIVGFPLVFETQPRPIPVDIPIEVPRKEGAPPLVMPAARPTATAPVASAASVDTSAAAAATAPNDVITETRDEAGREVTSAAASSTPTPRASAPKEPPKPAAKPPVTAAAEPKPELRAEAKPAADGDGARARALLEGKPAVAAAAAPADAGRFIVQVGAFADASAAHDMRLKVEKLGMKTYTQVASTASGNRIRVRVGPFGSRAEADKALAKAKAAGLSAVVLTL